MRTLLEQHLHRLAGLRPHGHAARGPAARASAKGYNIVSDGIAPGSIQVPGNGLPIVLLADRQTTGGYPKIATVISADIPALGRLTPGAKDRLRGGRHRGGGGRGPAASPPRSRHGGSASSPVRREPAIDVAQLLGENLVSGVVDARDWPLRTD